MLWSTRLLTVAALLAIQSIYISQQEQSDLIMFVERQDKNVNEENMFKVTCATNSFETAIAWIKPANVNSEHSITPKNTYQYNKNYNISKNSKINLETKIWKSDVWKFADSLTFNLGPVYDYRWEEFPTITTSGTAVHNGKFSISNNSNINFSIRLSTSTAYLAFYKHLQNNKKIMLQIRYDRKNNKFNYNVNETVSSLSTRKREAEDWHHFSVKQEHNSFTIWEDTEKIVTFPVDFEIDHFRISSKGEVEWKIHKYKFLFNSMASANQVGPKFGKEENWMCMHYYLAMCHHCSTMIRFSEQGNKNNIVEISYHENETYPHVQWKHEGGIREFNSNKHVLAMEVVTTTNKQDDQFLFGLDMIGRCNKNEMHKSTITVGGDILEKVKCYTLNRPDRKITIVENTQNTNADSPSICSKLPQENKKTCKFSCNDILGKDDKEGYCYNTKVCTLDRDEITPHCFCPPGFYGDFCYLKCGEGNTEWQNTWGDGCANKCSKGCKNGTCNNINGVCNPNGCTDDELYTGERCKLQYPILESMPEIKNIQPNSVVVEFDPNDIQNIPNSNISSLMYEIQYRKKGNEGWETTSSEQIKSNRKISNTITGLIRSTKYDWRVLLFNIHNNKKYEGILLKVGKNSTTCRIRNRTEDFYIKPANISVHIGLQLSDDGCASGKYKITFNDIYIPTSYTISETTNETISGLMPFRHYTMIIQSSENNVKTEIDFQTIPGAPMSVEDLEIFSISEIKNSISLRWKPNTNIPNGILKQYLIEYYITSTENAKKNKTIQKDDSPCLLYNDPYVCVEITNLQKYTRYTFSVFAQNEGTDYWGDSTHSVTSTVKEKASSVPLNCSLNDYVLHWDHPDKPNGDLKHFQVAFTALKNENGPTRMWEYTENILKLNETYKKTYKVNLFRYISKLNHSTTYEVRLRAIGNIEGNETIVHNNLVIPPQKVKFSNNGSLTLENDNSSLIVKLPEPRNETIGKNCSVKIFVAEVRENDSPTDTGIDYKDLLPNADNYNYKELHSSSQRSAGDNMQTLFETIKITKVQGRSRASNNSIPEFLYDSFTSNGKYIISVVYVNTYEGKRTSSSHNMTFPKDLKLDRNMSSSGLLFLLLLLILPIGLGIYLICRNKEKLKSKLSKTATNDFECVEEIRTEVPTPTTTTENGNRKSKSAVSTTIIDKQQNTLPIEDSETPLLKSRQKADVPSRIIDRNELENYIKKVIKTTGANGELQEQHKLLKRGQTKPWDYGILPENKKKNRYLNLMPYDYNRVKLKKIDGDQFSDYINASYINGYNHAKAYIATQGPKPNTLVDFWNMIWQEKVETIAMLANVIEGGKKKTEQYWPNINEDVTYGDIKVSQDRSQIYADFEYREFTVIRNEESRHILQLHFTAWPDHGVPMYSQSLVPFLKKLASISQETSPIVVHCSAGVGRTGTIILCDMALRMIDKENKVDFLGLLVKIREQRVNMVDNLDQYKLAHMVILEALSPDTTVECNEKFHSNIEKLITTGGTKKQFQLLNNTAWRDELEMESVHLSPENAKKNRVADILPDNYGRIYLQRYPLNAEDSDYINAVSVDGFRLKNRFIATQQPMPNTVGDFWRMVVEKNITVIVSLNEVKFGQTTVQFWPKKSTTMDPIDFISLQHISRKSTEGHDIIKIEIIVNNSGSKTPTNENDLKKSIVSIIQYKEWGVNDSKPESVASLMSLYNDVEKFSRNENPIVVTCHDGCRASGLFIGMSFVVEKVKLEQKCDACLAVRSIRKSRRQFITDQSQFEFLYYVANNYLDQFATYSNFQK